MTDQTINILCSCGSDKFEIPSNPKASDTITCAKCGAQEKIWNIAERNSF